MLAEYAYVNIKDAAKVPLLFPILLSLSFDFIDFSCLFST
jgi:hypothetical protein